MKVKLIDSMLGLIGNPKFCSIDEAIEYALAADGIGYFEEVMEREDMTLEKATALAFEVNEPRIWRILVEREDLDTKTAQSYALQVKKNKVWGAFLTRQDVPFVLAACRAQDLGQFDLWSVLLKRADATPVVVVEYALLAPDPILWEALLARKDIILYLETLDLTQILRVARSSASPIVWSIIVFKKVLLPGDRILYAIEANDDEIYGKLIQITSVVDHINKLQSSEALNLVVGLGYPKIRALVVERPSIKPAQLLNWLGLVKELAPAHWILRRKDVKNYIINLSLKKSFELSQLIGYINSCESSVLKEKIEAYLMTLPKKKALDLATKVNEAKLSAMLLGSERPDLPIKLVVKCAEEVNEELVWDAVVHRFDFYEYFDKMSDAVAWQFAERCNNVRIWARLLSWRNIAPETIISVSRRLNSDTIWSVVKLREDVINYLSS